MTNILEYSKHEVEETTELVQAIAESMQGKTAKIGLYALWAVTSSLIFGSGRAENNVEKILEQYISGLRIKTELLLAREKENHMY